MNNKLRHLTPVFKPVILIDLVLIVFVGIVCWLINWRTLSQFGFALVLVGGLICFIYLIDNYSLFQSIQNPGKRFDRVDHRLRRPEDKIARTREYGQSRKGRPSEKDWQWIAIFTPLLVLGTLLGMLF
ncbi:MAG: hypothetical protein P8183_22900 [Anaerolineae bacterium]|jgi:hypothetical protein